MNTFPENYIPDDRIDYYRMTSRVMAHIATKNGVEVDETTHQRWWDTMGLVREFDTFADEYCATPEEALSALEDFSLFAPRYPSLRREVLDPDARKEMNDHAQTILHLGQLLAEETDIERFIDLRSAEAYYSVMVLDAAATTFVRKQEQFGNVLWRVTGLCIGANLADSMLDARQDFARGKAKLEPSREFYKRAGLEAMRHAGPHAGDVLDLGGLKLRGQMIAHRVANRVKNGISPHSNLHLITSLWQRRPAQSQQPSATANPRSGACEAGSPQKQYSADYPLTKRRLRWRAKASQ